MIKSKYESRKRRSVKTRAVIARLNVPRLVVHRSNQHLYATIVVQDDNGNHRTIVSASTLEADLKKHLSTGKRKDHARIIGKTVIERAMKQGVAKLAFDRSGYKYHGCIKALADGAREAGAKF